MKRILLLFAAFGLLLSVQTISAQKFKIQPEYKPYKTDKDSWYPDKVHIVKSFEIEINKDKILFEQEALGKWKVTGMDTLGTLDLRRPDGGPLFWEFYLGKLEVNVIISHSVGNTNDPRLMEVVTTEDVIYLHNWEPDENSQWALSPTQTSWEVEDVLMSSINNWDFYDENLNQINEWDDTPEWKFELNDKKLDIQMQIGFIFASILAQNVRYGDFLK